MLTIEQQLIKDGGVSTSLMRRCDGYKYSICEELNLVAPDEVEKLHADFVNAGVDILTTNTFGSKQLKEDQAYKVNFEGTKQARKVADSTNREVFVAGNVGIFPIIKSESEADYIKHYKTQAEALCEGGADFIFIESIWDLSLAKLVTDSVIEIVEKHNKQIAFSVTVQTDFEGFVQDFANSFTKYNPLFLGLNCSNEPKSILKHAKLLSTVTDLPVLIAPNAGIPDSNGNYPVNPEAFLNELKPLIDYGKFSIIGGCCGTTPEHIKQIANYIKFNK